MKKFEVVVNQETVDYIERLSYELEGMKAIIKEIITDSQDNPLVLKGEGFKSYNAEYEERYAKYEIAKGEIQRTYIPAELIESGKVNKWNLDYATRVFTFEAEVPDDYELPSGDAK